MKNRRLVLALAMIVSATVAFGQAKVSPEIRKAQELAAAQAKEISAKNDLTAFEFRTNERGMQELYVDDYKRMEARSWTLITTFDYWKETSRWYFIVMHDEDGVETYGLFVLAIYDLGGRTVDAELYVPIDYASMEPIEGQEAVKCMTFGGAVKYFDFEGSPIAEPKGNSRPGITITQPAQTKQSAQPTQPAQSGAGKASPAAAQPKEADVSKEVYDRKFTPEVRAAKANITIKEIAIGKNYTRVKLVYVADNMADCFFLYRPYDPQGFRIEANGKTYYMVSQKGMKYRDEGRTCVNIKESLPFYLYFEALPEEVKKIDLVEEAAVIGVWVFRNVELKNKKKGLFDKLNDALDQVDEALDKADKMLK